MWSYYYFCNLSGWIAGLRWFYNAPSYADQASNIKGYIEPDTDRLGLRNHPWELGSDRVGLFAQILLTPTMHLW